MCREWIRWDKCGADCKVRQPQWKHKDINYRVIDTEKYYRSGVFRHFTEDCKCSTSMTATLNVELPDGYLHFAPIVNWGKYREENGRLMMPVSVRLNHAIADGFLVANVYRLLEKELAAFSRRDGGTD